jgi:hypothetical protein
MNKTVIIGVVMVVILGGPAWTAGTTNEVMREVRRAERRALEGDAASARAELTARVDAGETDVALRLALAALEPEPHAKLKLLYEAVQQSPELQHARGLLAQQYLKLGQREPAEKVLAGCAKPVVEPTVVVANARRSCLLGDYKHASELLWWHSTHRPSPAVLAELACFPREKLPEISLRLAGLLALARDPGSRDGSRYDLRDARLAELRCGYSRCESYFPEQSEERMVLAQSVARENGGDAESQLSAARLLWLGQKYYGKGLMPAIRAADASGKGRLDVRIWRGVLELCGFAGQPSKGYELLSKLPAAPTTAAGPVLLEMSHVAKGLHFYAVADWAAAAREFGAAATTAAWLHGGLLADALAAKGQIAAARHVAEAWSRLPADDFGGGSRPGIVRDKLANVDDSEPCGPFLASAFWMQWEVIMCQDRGGDPYPPGAAWMRDLLDSGHSDWVQSAFAATMGSQLRDRQRLAKALGRPLPPGLPESGPVPLAARPSSPLDGGLNIGPPPSAEQIQQLMQAQSQAAEAAGAGAPARSRPRDWLLWLLAGGAGASALALLTAPKTADRKRRLLLTCLTAALVLTSGLRWWSRGRSMGSALATGAIGEMRPDPQSGTPAARPADSPATPREEMLRLLTAASVPSTPVATPACFRPVMEHPDLVRQGRGDLPYIEELDEFDKWKGERRSACLEDAGATAFPYLMQRLAFGDPLEQEMAAALLAQAGDRRALELVRRVAHEHVASTYAGFLMQLGLGNALQRPYYSTWAAHWKGCRAIRALASFGDRQSIPLILEALDSAEPRMCEEARMAMVALTGAVGPRWASEWREVLASPGFQGKQ